MPTDEFISDDPGTILDSYENAAKILAAGLGAGLVAPARPVTAASEEVLYRSPYRWTAPRILICDDGSLNEGEIVYVRSDKITIGRTQGDIVIGHDVAMSSSHAEIARRDSGGKHAWVLRDLGSSNGTLARFSKVTLKPGTTLQLGSKRYRFEQAGATQLPAADVPEPKTALLTHLPGESADFLPALVDVTVGGGGQESRHPFRTTRVTIGRPGFGNTIGIDDLCLASTHAVVTRDVSGVWQLEAQPSLNGVWAKVDAIRLCDNCYFQCGEQRFRFRL